MGQDRREFIMNQLMSPEFMVHETQDITLLETEEASKSMFKRVDHIIFGRQCSDKWKLYLIEMKGSVGKKKWDEIKGKFRASYLLALAIAGMLELDIVETVMYTTYEKVQFRLPDTMPAARRGTVGGRYVRMEQEWEGECFGLNFGERIPFVHKPVRMDRDKEGVLSGSLAEES